MSTISSSITARTSLETIGAADSTAGRPPISFGSWNAVRMGPHSIGKFNVGPRGLISGSMATKASEQTEETSKLESSNPLWKMALA